MMKMIMMQVQLEVTKYNLSYLKISSIAQTHLHAILA